MNLADLLVPKPRSVEVAFADLAERADSDNARRESSPQARAESGGSLVYADGDRRIPPTGAGSDSALRDEFPLYPPVPPIPILEIQKPLAVTRESLTSLGLEVSAEDVAFLVWYLPRSTTARNRVLLEYVARWQQEMIAEPLEHRKQNRGRFAANCWIRETKISKKGW